MRKGSRSTIFKSCWAYSRNVIAKPQETACQNAKFTNHTSARFPLFYNKYIYGSITIEFRYTPNAHDKSNPTNQLHDGCIRIAAITAITMTAFSLNRSNFLSYYSPYMVSMKYHPATLAAKPTHSMGLYKLNSEVSIGT